MSEKKPLCGDRVKSVICTDLPRPEIMVSGVGAPCACDVEDCMDKEASTDAARDTESIIGDVMPINTDVEVGVVSSTRSSDIPEVIKVV